MSSDAAADRPPEGAFAGTYLDRLWTPWRREYVAGAAASDCFLCELAKPGGDDAANLVVYRSNRVLAVLNRYPYNPGHLLVAPRAHGGDLVALAPADRDEIFELVQRAAGILAGVYAPGGFNVGMNLGRVAGAGVPDHLHMHILPRWPGDTNYMTVTADTRVLPEALDQTYHKLRPLFA